MSSPISVVHYASLSFIYFAILQYVLYVSRDKTPMPLTKENEIFMGYKDHFIEERARESLKRLTKHQSHVSGSWENDVDVFNYILNTVQNIKADQTLSKMEIDVQHVSGAYKMGFSFLPQHTNIYNNVTNIIVKLTPHGHESSSSVLFNSHYDTSINATGASDDLVAVSVMLEVLRVMSKDRNLKHSLVFLFNGAEENILQAAHGFISKHKWANNIDVFINLEGVGAGNKEVVFQTGPSNPWIIKAYSNAVPHPSASSGANDLFNSGLVPGITDFAIFSAHGNIPGIDLVFFSNGLFYHTVYDTEDRVSKGILQRVGENILALAKHFGHSDKIVDEADLHGTMVFFDFFGFFMILFPQRILYMLSHILLCAFFIFLVKKSRALKDSVGTGHFISLILKAFIWIIISFGFIFAFSAFTSQILYTCGRHLSWINNYYILFGLYFAPGFSIFIFMQKIFKESIMKSESPVLLEQIVLYANMILFGLLSCVYSHFGLTLGFFPFLILAFPFIFRLVLVELILEINLGRSPSTLFKIHILCNTIPLAYIVYMTYGLLVFLVPVLSRVFQSVYPDLVAALACSLYACYVTSSWSNLLYMTKNLSRYAVFFLCIWLLSVTYVFTPMGFPFTADPSYPVPSRLIAFHVRRNFHNAEVYEKVDSTDSGLFLVSFDIFKHEHLTPYMKNYKPEHRIQFDFENTIYTDFPQYFPLAQSINDPIYIPDVPPDFPYEISFEMLNKEQISKNEVSYTFRVKGPDRISLIFKRKNPGTKMKNWSFPTNHPNLTDEAWFCFIYNGFSNGTLDFSFSLTNDNPDTTPKIDISFITHSVHTFSEVDPVLVDFRNSLPQWAHPYSAVSSLDIYHF